MKFGKTDIDINSVNFKLPADTSFTNRILSSNKKAAKTLLYAGCAKFGRKDWIGGIYPAGTKEKDFLQHYIQRYNSIELNATFYKIYDAPVIAKWAAAAKGFDFVFCPKMSKAITQFSDLTSSPVKTKLSAFIRGIRAFKEHLGPVFIQLNERYAPDRKEGLYQFLSSLPKDIQFFLELRHEQWFTDKQIREEWKHRFAELNVGVVITDTAGRRDAVHMELTIPKAFIRFEGNGLHASDYTRVDAWVKRISKWKEQGLKEAYFFMHQEDERNSPVLCDYAVKKLKIKKTF